MSNRQDYICFNGHFIKQDEPILTHHNRGFKYGDAVFETIFITRSAIPFLDDHYKRLLTSLKLLKMNMPPNLTKDAIAGMIIKLINKNRVFKGGRVKLTVFRNDGGLYTPLTNDTSYIIELNRLEQVDFNLNERGFVIDVYPVIKKPLNILSNLKTANAELFVLAGIYKQEHDLDECIILNERNVIAETMSSNIYLVKDKKIYTPPLTDGCIAGVMRKQILRIAVLKGYQVFDNKSIRPQDFLLADEAFISNAVKGIQWIVAFREKRFFNKTAKTLIEALNEDIKKKNEDN